MKQEIRFVFLSVATFIAIYLFVVRSAHGGQRKLGDSAEIVSAIYNIDSIAATDTEKTKPYCLMFSTMWKGDGRVDTSKHKHLELYRIYGWRDTISVSRDGDVFTGKELCLDTAARDDDRLIAAYAKFELTKKQEHKLQKDLDSCTIITVLEADLTVAQRNHFRAKTKHFKGMGNIRLTNRGRRLCLDTF